MGAALYKERAGGGAGPVSRVRASILGVPLLGKLIGANVIIVLAAIAVQAFFFHSRSSTEILIVLAALASESIPTSS